MNTAVFFPGYRMSTGDLEHAPLKLLASIPEAGSLIHFYRGSLNRNIYRDGLYHNCIGTAPTKAGFAADYLVKSFSYLRSHKISLIYCCDPETAFLLRWASRCYRIPMILQIGIDWNAYDRKIESSRKRRLKKQIRRQALKDAAAVVTLAHHLVDPIRDCGRTPSVLYPFIDLDAYPVTPASGNGSLRELIFVGRLAPVKGARYLVDCLPLVLGKRRDFHLRIVGGSLPGRRSDEIYIRRQIEVNGLSAHVTLEGQVPNSKVVEYLRKADLAIMPSETEGFHYALLEAWACGVPVLGTDIPFHRELIDKDTGRLCGFSPQSMAGGILEFLSMENDRLLQMKQTARRRVEKLTADSMQPWRDFFKTHSPCGGVRRPDGTAE